MHGGHSQALHIQCTMPHWISRPNSSFGCKENSGAPASLPARECFVSHTMLLAAQLLRGVRALLICGVADRRERSLFSETYLRVDK